LILRLSNDAKFAAKPKKNFCDVPDAKKYTTVESIVKRNIGPLTKSTAQERSKIPPQKIRKNFLNLQKVLKSNHKTLSMV